MGKTRRIAAVASFPLLLAACTAQETLTPERQPGERAASLVPATQGTAQPSAPGLAPGLADVRVRFAPIVGSTLDAVTPMSRRISLRAREAGLQIVRADDPAQTHLVKGYFSALADAGQTTVIYVWDILDATGNRVHRIQGKQVVPGEANAADPWQVVPAATMEQIADLMMRELVAWLSTHAPGSGNAG